MTIVELTRLIFALFQSILNASFEIKRQDFYALIDRRSHTNALLTGNLKWRVFAAFLAQ